MFFQKERYRNREKNARGKISRKNFIFFIKKGIGIRIGIKTGEKFSKNFIYFFFIMKDKGIGIKCKGKNPTGISSFLIKKGIEIKCKGKNPVRIPFFLIKKGMIIGIGSA